MDEPVSGECYWRTEGNVQTRARRPSSADEDRASERGRTLFPLGGGCQAGDALCDYFLAAAAIAFSFPAG